MSSSGTGARYRGPKDLSTQDAHAVARSAGVVGGATLASRVLGLVRDAVLAASFSQSATDAFFIAFMIPNLFRRLVGEGALTVSFLPIFTGWLQRSRAEALRVFNATWTLAALVGLGITLLGIVLADPLVRLFAPGFVVEPDKFALCVTLLRLCFPYILLLMLVAVAMGALNAVGHFLAPAISPVLLNVCTISAALAAGALFDPPILALGYAVIVAGVLQVALQIPPLRAHQLKPRPLLEPGHPALRRLGVVMAPAVLGASVYQLNVLVSRFLASFEGDGAVSNLYYADRLIEFPLGVFVFAISMASLPSLARFVKAEDRDGLAGSFVNALALALALAIPSTLGLAILAGPIVLSLFAWDPAVFGADAIAGCARALVFYALGLIPITVSRIYVNLCMAHENARTPARGAWVSLFVNALASLALVGPLPLGALPEALLRAQHALAFADLGYPGLALASSFAALANAVYLASASHRRYGRLIVRADLGRLARLGLAGGAMAVAVGALAGTLAFGSQASLGNLSLLALVVGIGALLYLVVLRALRAPEYAALMAAVRRRASSTPDAGS